VPGRDIPLVTTDLVLRRFGVGWIGDLQHQLLVAAAERELASNRSDGPSVTRIIRRPLSAASPRGHGRS
jgi:hypothetical protein